MSHSLVPCKVGAEAENVEHMIHVVTCLTARNMDNFKSLNTDMCLGNEDVESCC
jgi:hypothetical protein